MYRKTYRKGKRNKEEKEKKVWLWAAIPCVRSMDFKMTSKSNSCAKYVKSYQGNSEMWQCNYKFLVPSLLGTPVIQIYHGQGGLMSPHYGYISFVTHHYLHGLSSASLVGCWLLCIIRSFDINFISYDTGTCWSSHDTGFIFGLYTSVFVRIHKIRTCQPTSVCGSDWFLTDPHILPSHL